MGANAILYPILPGNLTLGRETEEGEGRVETVEGELCRGCARKESSQEKSRDNA